MVKEEVLTRFWVLGYVPLGQVCRHPQWRKNPGRERLEWTRNQTNGPPIWVHRDRGMASWEFLIQQIWSGAQEFAFLPISLPGNADAANPSSPLKQLQNSILESWLSWRDLDRLLAVWSAQRGGDFRAVSRIVLSLASSQSIGLVATLWQEKERFHELKWELKSANVNKMEEGICGINLVILSGKLT